MAYKLKPNKAVAKRFRVTKTGKLKRHHSYTSHLMSSRSANKRRKLRRSAILFEGHARNMRELMGIHRMKPAQVAHERALAEKQKGAEGEGDTGTTATKSKSAAAAKPQPAKATAEKRQKSEKSRGTK